MRDRKEMTILRVAPASEQSRWVCFVEMPGLLALFRHDSGPDPTFATAILAGMALFRRMTISGYQALTAILAGMALFR
jgi:hypothetical protein